MAETLKVPALVGVFVRLEPLSEDHLDGLVAAADDERSSFGYTPVPHGREAVVAYVEELLAARSSGKTIPFAQVSVGRDQAVGVTRFRRFRARAADRRPYAVEIGGTWLAGSVQRTGINTEAKLLLLRHAFEVWAVERLDLKADARNSRSRAAIARLGASCEGVLRRWEPSFAPGEEDQFRDTAIYSILLSEWPPSVPPSKNG